MIRQKPKATSQISAEKLTNDNLLQVENAVLVKGASTSKRLQQYIAPMPVVRNTSAMKVLPRQPKTTSNVDVELAKSANQVIISKQELLLAVNKALSQSNFASAEYLLQRPLTTEEIINKSLSGAQYGPAKNSKKSVQLDPNAKVIGRPHGSSGQAVPPGGVSWDDLVEQHYNSGNGRLNNLLEDAVAQQRRPYPPDNFFSEYSPSPSPRRRISPRFNDDDRSTVFEEDEKGYEPIDPRDVELAQLASMEPYNEIVQHDDEVGDPDEVSYGSSMKPPPQYVTRIQNELAQAGDDDEARIAALDQHHTKLLLQYYQHYRKRDGDKYYRKGIAGHSKKKIMEWISDHQKKYGYGLRRPRRTTAGIWKTFPNGVLGVDVKTLGKGILSVRHHNSKHKVLGIPNISISPKYKTIILSLLNGIEPDIKGMKADEKLHLKKVIAHSHAGVVKGKLPSLKKKKRGPPSLIDDLKNKFKIMIGEISAGNSSEIMRGQLSELLSTMVAKKLITEKQSLSAKQAYLVN